VEDKYLSKKQLKALEDKMSTMSLEGNYKNIPVTYDVLRRLKAISAPC